jgi:signal transduction histidine kinase/CheY-like chemotaxis protein
MSDAEDERVLVWAPRGRDGAIAVDVLVRRGFRAVQIHNAPEMCAALEEGAGCGLLTEETLTPALVLQLTDVLSRQPPWSDLPLLIFGEKLRGLELVDVTSPLGNVTYLDRPVQIRTLVTAVRAALRSRRRQYAARTAIARRDEFLAMLGHELRNPLAAIVFACEMADRERDRTAQARQHAVIQRQARHLSRLVDDLLDVARVTSGKVVLRREAVDFAALVERCVQQAEAAAAGKAQSLEFRAGVARIVVDGDPVRFDQIAMNLLMNAVKYTPRGGHIEVEVDRDGDQAVLRVRDDGIGIDPAVSSTIFELFAQAPSSLDRSEGGLGLGLTLVRTLVHLHGGSVSAFSEGPGRGSEFVVRVPAAVGPTLVRERKTTLSAVEPLFVVLLDDNTDLREMLAQLLREFGHRVEEAGDGPSGLRTILALRPDVAVIDIGLPGMDGFEVARGIRAALGDAIRLVAITGYGQPEDRERTRAAGYDVHVVKPASADEILASLRGPKRPAVGASG